MATRTSTPRRRNTGSAPTKTGSAIACTAVTEEDVDVTAVSVEESTTAESPIPTEWTEAAWKALEAYIEECASLMKLSDWNITLLEEDAGEDADASVSVTYGKKKAYVRVGQGFVKLTPQEQRQTICHELVHIHLYDLGHFFNKSFDEFVSPEAKRGLMIGYTLVDETATDVLADLIAPTLPLPWGL